MGQHPETTQPTDSIHTRISKAKRAITCALYLQLATHLHRDGCGIDRLVVGQVLEGVRQLRLGVGPHKVHAQPRVRQLAVVGAALHVVAHAVVLRFEHTRVLPLFAGACREATAQRIVGATEQSRQQSLSGCRPALYTRGKGASSGTL